MANLALIRTLCDDKGITLTDFAASVDLSRQQLTKMMRSGTTTISTLETIAAALHVSPAIFFGEHVKNQKMVYNTGINESPNSTQVQGATSAEVAVLQAENTSLKAVNAALQGQVDALKIANDALSKLMKR